MFSTGYIEKLLFIDIETAAGLRDWVELSPILQAEWAKKSKRLFGEDAEASDTYKERAAIYSEFGRIVCISCGYIKFKEGIPTAQLKSVTHTDEKILLQEFAQLLTAFNSGWQFCGHNIREFDGPYLARRMAIQQINPMPSIFNLFGKKKWDIPFVDTMELWQCGDFKAYTSLQLLTEVLGIASPKADFDGAQVSKAFWENNALQQIATYCEADVRAVMQVVLRLSGLPLLA